MYTIGEVSRMFDLPISTLRYYDKEGLLPDLERVSGIRKFDDKALDSLRVIECLKKSGMEIRDIKEFMMWCSLGSETYPQRRDMFLRQKAAVENEIHKLQNVLDMINFKCWYYEQAIADGSEEHIAEMIPKKLPPELLAAYERSHHE